MYAFNTRSVAETTRPMAVPTSPLPKNAEMKLPVVTDASMICASLILGQPRQKTRAVFPGADELIRQRVDQKIADGHGHLHLPSPHHSAQRDQVAIAGIVTVPNSLDLRSSGSSSSSSRRRSSRGRCNCRPCTHGDAEQGGVPDRTPPPVCLFLCQNSLAGWEPY